jgi:hypothetical protein
LAQFAKDGYVVLRADEWLPRGKEQADQLATMCETGVLRPRPFGPVSGRSHVELTKEDEEYADRMKEEGAKERADKSDGSTRGLGPFHTVEHCGPDFLARRKPVRSTGGLRPPRPAGRFCRRRHLRNLVPSRTEAFADHHTGLGQFLRGPGSPLARVVSHIAEEDVVLFKDEVDYKASGGGQWHKGRRGGHQRNQAGKRQRIRQILLGFLPFARVLLS